MSQIRKSQGAVFCFCFLALSLHISVSAAENLPSSPVLSRIISAGGSVTEIAYALGLGDSLVAVDSSSLYPPEATQLPQVGYFRSLGAEGLMSLNPTLIIGAKGAGPEVVLQQVENLGVPVELFEQSDYTLESWKTLITEMGSYFDRPQQAQELIDSVSTELEVLADNRKYPDQEIHAVTLLSLGQRGPIAAGRNTVPDLLFSLAGINNLATGVEGYKPLSTELLADQELDLVLIPSHVADSLGGESAICENVVLKLAMRDRCNVHIMDGLLLMGFGARLDQAVASVIRQANRI